jgi:hypothetical protein
LTSLLLADERNGINNASQGEGLGLVWLGRDWPADGNGRQVPGAEKMFKKSLRNY